MVHGVRETVLGTLGKATILRIPPDLQNLTLDFGAAVWKRDTEDPQRKLILLKYLDGKYTNYMQERTRFHMLDFSLEILNTSRQDRQLYEYIVRFPRHNPLPLPSLSPEPVSDPTIQILGWVLANDTCNITLNCTAERGDNISYSWGSGDNSTSGLCSHNSSLLHLTYPLQNSSISCSCTTSNPVSTQVIAFNSSKCSYKQMGESPVANPVLSSLLKCWGQLVIHGWDEPCGGTESVPRKMDQGADSRGPYVYRVAWFSAELGSRGVTVGLSDLKRLFQPS
uniref:Ig-like domain-containing protein n=1 Tax=Strigops habroptila TaxID=2489341 RepID=A0A672UJQ6_STRHB